MKIHLIILLILFCSLTESRRRFGGGRSSFTRGSTVGVGKGIATLIKHMSDETVGSQQDLLLSGKKVNQPINTFKMHEQMGITGSTSWLVVIGLTTAGVFLILCIAYQLTKSSQEETNWARIRQRNHDRDKNYAALQAIAEHGVHPDRATGKIYRMRL